MINFGDRPYEVEISVAPDGRATSPSKRYIIVRLPEWAVKLRRLSNQAKRNIVGGAMIGFSLSVMVYLLTLA